MKLRKLLCSSLLSVVILAASFPAYAADTPGSSSTLPAFPGAEGGGMYTTGGRGGTVYEVTNLDDSGPGSLRDAVSQSNRIIVFRVSGNIQLASSLNITGSNLTIAGQTAPGDGISINNYSVYVKADNIIMRYLRFRMGDESPAEGDSMSIDSRKNIIIDHCSFEWAIDEVLSPQTTDNLTVQWSIIGEALHMSKHEKGRHGFGGLWGAGNTSYHHNLLVHNSSRNPRFKGRTEEDKRSLDYRNNVVYNWNYKTAYGGGSANVNMINNYNKYGPDTDLTKRDLVLDELGLNGQWYIDGNNIDGSPSVTADNWLGVHEFTPTNTRLYEPVPSTPVTTHTPEEAYELVLAQAGAILPKRDSVDSRIVNDVRNRTGRQINSPAEVGGWPILNSIPAPTDTDHDGMPDEWELAHGLNPNDPEDRNGDVDGDGYPNLENYLNSIVGNGSQSPTVQITTPSINTITDTGTTITINAEATDPDGSVSKVEFYRNNTKLGEDDTAPYQFTWSNVPEGTYFLIAKAIDNSGTSTDSDAVPVHINAPGDITPWSAVDIGNPGLPGHSNLNDGVFTVKSSGNISTNPESFQFAYQKLTGDGQLIARIDKITHTTPLAKAGVMIREKLTPGSRLGLMGLAVRGDGHVAEFYSRETEGTDIVETPPLPSINPPYYVKIVKFGGTVTGYISQEGTNWSSIGSMPLDANEVYIGLMADAAKENNLIENYNKSTFSQVKFETIAPVPYRPTGVAVSRGTSDLLVSWSPAERATSYQVKRSLTPGGPYTTVATVSSNEYLDTQVEAGVNYFYVIKAANAAGESLEDSEERNGALLGTPAAVILINDDFESMTVGAQPEGYDSRPIPGTDQNHILVDEVPSSPAGNHSSKLLNLYDDSTSQTRASKAFPAQQGTVIAEVDVMQTAGADYPRVLRLLDTAFGKQYVEIFSGYGAGCPTAYCFYYRNTDTSNGKAVPLPTNNEFKPNTWYHVKVVADIKTQMAEVFINGVSAGAITFHKDKGWPDAAKLSAIDFLSSAKDKVNEYIDNVRIGVPALGAPTGVTSAVYGNAAQISWSALPGATSYNLYRSEGDGGRFRLVASAQTDLSYMDKGLAYDKTYTYVVAAVNNTIEGDYSAPVSVTPEGPLVIQLDQQSGSVTQATYGISGSVSRAAAVKVNGNAVPVGSDLKFSTTLNLNQGNNLIKVEAADSTGAQAEPVSLMLFVDSIVPELRLNQSNGSVSTAVYSISGTISEPGKVFINGKETAVDSNLQFNQKVNLVKGANEFTVTAVDLLGNSAAPKKVTITYDTVKPVVTIDNPHGGHGNGKDDQVEVGNYTITGKISEPGTVTANGYVAKVNADLTYSVIVPLRKGRNRIVIEGKDLAGNRSDSITWEVVATKKGSNNGHDD
ncbi:Ig-like domain-containing protein [Paenibacillus sp. UNC451MF]|uniref:Ig-like domain-containing protein n=1 Tax=Paenibacillus sp. UNC451MF TaxID=1449063 RepID=UPI0007E8EC6D|nr:Ig-like domain-containing protein [Paenibacillus sp. UNC451MF]